MIPAHELEHIERVAAALEAQPEAIQQRWARALDHVENARVYDAFLEYNELLKNALDPLIRTHVQLQAIRCLRDAPVERVKTELALIEPHDAYQTVVLDYRLGWLMRHRLMSLPAALQYFDRVREEARRLGSRPWEIAALLQKATTLMGQGLNEQGIEVCMRVYNLSRRNGLGGVHPEGAHVQGLRARQAGPARGGRGAAPEVARAGDPERPRGRAGPGAPPARAGVPLRPQVLRPRAGVLRAGPRRLRRATPVWPSLRDRVEEDAAAAQRELADLDLAKILGPIPINRLRQEYLTSLVNGFVGIPGIDNRSQLGKRIGLTRQAIHRNINS